MSPKIPTEQELQGVLEHVKVQVDPTFNKSLQAQLQAKAQEIRKELAASEQHSRSLKKMGLIRKPSTDAEQTEGIVFPRIRLNSLTVLSSAVVAIAVLVFAFLVIVQPLLNSEPIEMADLTPVTTGLPVAATSEPLDLATLTVELPVAETFMSRIAFVSDLDGSSEIYTMNTDGTDIVQLTNNDTEVRGLGWSPDGSRIAFLTGRDTEWGVYLIDADGSNQTRLANIAGYGIAMNWSPDGENIAFSAITDGTEVALYLVNVNNQTTTLVRENGIGDFDWAPDSQSLAFITSSHENASAIVTYELSSGNLTSLATAVSDSARLDWRPDGSQIAFTSVDPALPSGKHISLLNIDGAETTTVTTQPMNITLLRWSPQGTYLAYYVWDDAAEKPQVNIYVTDAQGSAPIYVATAVAPMGFDWSPDESKIVFKSEGENGKGVISVVNRDGSGLYSIGITGMHNLMPSWSPLIATISPSPTSSPTDLPPLTDMATITSTPMEPHLPTNTATLTPTSSLTSIPTELPPLAPWTIHSVQFWPDVTVMDRDATVDFGARLRIDNNIVIRARMLAFFTYQGEDIPGELACLSQQMPGRGSETFWSTGTFTELAPGSNNIFEQSYTYNKAAPSDATHLVMWLILADTNDQAVACWQKVIGL
ncbi:MAG: PD40 domain-containing protein [Anaerolineae bacterium]|nr:PD40 domain-containing protein [Anaerolineae bacterium]